MKKLKNSDNPIVLRTYFSNNKLWEILCNQIKEIQDDFVAKVDFIDDIEYENININDLNKIIDENYEHSIIFLVDKDSLYNKDNPIICVDLIEDSRKYIRVVPSQMWSIENNLSIANMDFDEFYDNVDADLIFRGFK